MVELQLATGARPGEVTSLRPRDVARPADSVWTYGPVEHKTEHLDRQRPIFLGPRAQELPRPWLDRDPDAPCFSPAEVVEARNARRRAGRRGPGIFLYPVGRFRLSIGRNPLISPKNLTKICR